MEAGTAVFARILGTLFNTLLGVLIYLSKQLLDHRPKTFISQSGMFAAAAVVAAPILKLWDEMFWLLAPWEKHCRRMPVMVDLVRYVPSEKVKSGLSFEAQFGKCVCKARTGQTLVCEGARWIS